MAQKRCRKAQISLFLIMGILLLFAVGFIYYVSSQVELAPREITLEQSVSQLVGQCLKKRVIEGYALDGINPERIRRYIDHELLSCADLNLFEDQADISHGDIFSTVQVSDKVISAEIMLPIIIKQGNSVIQLDSFNYILPRYRTTKLPIDSGGRLTQSIIVRSADDRLELYLEQGTIAKTNDEKPLEEITIHTRSVTQRDPTLFYYTVYDLQPHGAYFSQKSKLSMKYVPSFNIEEHLFIVKREVDSNFWKIMDSTPNTERQMIETAIHGFSEIGMDPECESRVFVDTGEIDLAQEADSCRGEYLIELTNSDSVLCELHLVDSALEEKITPQGLRMNNDDEQNNLYDQELIGLSCKDEPEEERENCLHDPKVLETINTKINNELKNEDNPNQVQFYVYVNNSDGGDCSDKRANLVFMLIGKNLECGNIGLSSGQCCDDIAGCTVTEPILPPDQQEPKLDEPEACGNKKGIMLHLQDTFLNPHEDYWPFLLQETKLIVGDKGWVLETVGIGNPIGDTQAFIQTAKSMGMRPIMRLMPKQDSSGFDPVEFANYAYDMSEGDDYFVQVCNEPNHPPDEGLNNPCYMPDADEYARHLMTFSEKLHELDSEKRIKILNAGLDPTDSAGYAQQMFDFIAGQGEDRLVIHDTIDIWASHAYDTEAWDAEMDVVSKENFPVILTEAGYNRHDQRYKDLCPGEGVTKLLYQCLNPFAGLDELKKITQGPEFIVDDAACKALEWNRCENFCKDNFPKCEKTVFDPSLNRDVTVRDCDVCLELGLYTEEEVEYCCKECTYWCVIDDDKDIDWDNVNEWKDAQNDYAGYIQSKLGEWSHDDQEEVDVIGIIPFLQIDGKEMTGKVVKFDYECEDASNWRPYYWEYVNYEGEEGVDPYRSCKEVSAPLMEDPYHYPVMDQNSGMIPTDYCPYAESGFDLDDTGISSTPVPGEEWEGEVDEEEGSCVTGDCLTLCLDTTCDNGLVSWTAKMTNPGCEYDEDFGDTFLDVMPLYDAPLECNYGIKGEGGIFSREHNVIALIAPQSTVTISGFHNYGTGIHPLQFCLHSHTLEDSSWDEHDNFCVSTQIECE